MIQSIQPKFSASCCQFSGQQQPKFQGKLLNQGQAMVKEAYTNVQSKIAPLQQGLKLNVLA